jgi:formylglycine-generating enzyme required for sulfatase activity
MKRIFISAILLFIIAAGANAQNKTLKVHKNGTVYYQEFVSSIDSVIFENTLRIPASVAATLNSGSQSITITWAAVSGATHYEVYRSGDNVTYTLLASNVVATTYTDNAPLRGSNYYRIRAKSATLSSDFSSISAPITFAGVESGLYLGVIGFNDNIYTKPIGRLTKTTKDDYHTFVNNLTSKDGTVLYYAVDNALTHLVNTTLPNDLVNVAIVTFTDGVDQGSHMLNPVYQFNDALYLAAINNRIHQTQIKGLNINAYSIGIRGKDVENDTVIFRSNLENLASDAQKVFEITTTMDSVKAVFQAIADSLYKENKTQGITLKIPGQEDGTKVRFTFDNVVDSTVYASGIYIEGTFHFADKSLQNVAYQGCVSSSGALVDGSTANRIFVDYTFENVNTDLPLTNIQQWEWISSTSSWQINSEFTTAGNTVVTPDESSAVVLLILDCSSSLDTGFSAMQNTANDFITTLVEGINKCETVTDSIAVTVTSSYTWGGQIYTASGVYQQTFTTADGCDSIVTLTLTVDPFAFVYEPEMVPVQGGTTTLNGTTVTISNFNIGKYEITQKIWEEVMAYSGPTAAGGSLSATTAYPGGSSYMPTSTYGDGDNYPVYYVSYDDVVNIFLPRLNAITGKTYRLPTEAEWEYAAKGGQQTHNYTYSGSNTIGNVAWYNGNSSMTHIVGTKSPNELGIYDMSGNVWEWCRDWYGSTYPSGTNNPTGPSSGSNRMARGGSWSRDASSCGVAYRVSDTPGLRGNNVGFRVVISSSPTTSFSYEPEMVPVPGGTTSLNGTTVTISNFNIGKYEITQKIWEEVMAYSGPTAAGGSLSATTAYPGGSSYMPNATYGDGDNYPVYYVSYTDIVNTFIPRLNAITGKTYRLPTEAEWEYAAKGGQQTHNYTYSGSNTIGNVAWYDGNSGNISHIVGTKSPNELGIYDMSGNVWEWCSDWYGSTYPSGTTNPTGASSGSNRVFRGGSWLYDADLCRVSYRNYSPSVRSSNLGFRLACSSQ